MSSIVIAIALISIVAFVCFILVSINNRDRRKKALELIVRFDSLAEENNLSVSEKEILQDLIVGVDIGQKKLLALKRTGEHYDPILVDLNEVIGCIKKSIWRNIKITSGKKEKYESRVDQIVLEFDYTDKRPPVTVPFCESVTGHIFDMAQLERKVKDWETALNKIIASAPRKIA